MDLIRSHVMVCGGTGCSSSNSGEIIKEFEKQLAEKGLDKEVKVVRTGCFVAIELTYLAALSHTEIVLVSAYTCFLIQLQIVGFVHIG